MKRVRHLLGASFVILGLSHALRAITPPAAMAVAGGFDFDGSTIDSMANGFQLGTIYRRFPADDLVHPLQPWELGVGVFLDTPAPSVSATLALANPGQNPDIQILDNSAMLAPDASSNLSHNYDPAERFQIVYLGSLDPFDGHIDFVLEAAGFPAILFRVHLNVTDRTGFPLPVASGFADAAQSGNIIGDGDLEILIPGRFEQQGLFAFDHSGTLLPGWPFLNTDPDVLEQSFGLSAIVDLDGDGHAEVVVVGNALRNVQGGRSAAGTTNTYTLYALEGDGTVRWEVDADFNGIPSVADLDGDGSLDIIVSDGTNLTRISAAGVPDPQWSVQAPNNIRVDVPVIADVDGNPANGKEIVGCASITQPPFGRQMYVWNEDGSLHDPSWPRTVEDCQPPTVLDLDLDPANGLEILTGADHDDDPPVDPKTGFLNTFSVFAWHADGTDVNGWPHHFMRPPNVTPDDRLFVPFAAGDLEGDGDMEVVVGTYGQGDPANGNLFVFHHDGTLDPNWPQWAGIAQTPSIGGGPALGDLDGDGSLEIVTGSFHGVYVFRATGELFDGFPRLTPEVFAQTTLADLDSDGRLEILSSGENTLLDRLFVWSSSTPGPDPSPWPMYRQNSAHTGTLIRPPAAPIPTLAEASLAIMFVVMVAAGIFIVRRGTRTTLFLFQSGN